MFKFKKEKKKEYICLKKKLLSMAVCKIIKYVLYPFYCFYVWQYYLCELEK